MLGGCGCVLPTYQTVKEAWLDGRCDGQIHEVKDSEGGGRKGMEGRSCEEGRWET